VGTRDTDIAHFPGLFETSPGANAGQTGERLPESSAACWDAEAALRALFDSVHCGILIFGPDGELRAVNDHLAEMLGYDKSELLGLGAFDDVVAALCQGFVDSEVTASHWRERYHAAMPCWDEVECVSPNRKHLERFGRPIVAADGSRSGWLEVYGDVTGQKLMEGKLFQIERMVTLGQLVAGVAHELSNPLTSILGYAQLLRRRIHTFQGGRGCGAHPAGSRAGQQHRQEPSAVRPWRQTRARAGHAE
jgi:PAS domain S-box-containing protein